MVGMAERVAGAVDARPFAVPDAENAVVLALAAELGLLRAPKRGRREVLVEAGLEDDIVGFEEFPGALKGLIEPAERGAAIAGHIAGGVEATRRVQALLHHRQANDGLASADVNPLLAEIVFVVEADLGKGHGTTSFKDGVKLAKTIR